MRPRDLRVAERPEYPQYPGVVGGLAGVTEREREVTGGHRRSLEVCWCLLPGWGVTQTLALAGREAGRGDDPAVPAQDGEDHGEGGLPAPRRGL